MKQKQKTRRSSRLLTIIKFILVFKFRKKTSSLVQFHFSVLFDFVETNNNNKKRRKTEKLL